MRDQPLLIALVAVQFLVHALGWGMTARLTRQWRSPEGHFAAFWLLLGIGLLLFVPPWASGSAPRNLADLLIIAAVAMQHRGMSLHWNNAPPDRGYLALLAAAALALVISHGLDHGHGLRVATVCLGGGVLLTATVRLVWQQGRLVTPRFAKLVSASYGLLAVALFVRAAQVLLAAPQTKISIDAPGNSNVPFAIIVMFVGGLVNLAQIRLVLGRVLAQLTAQANTDTLTGAMNRRGVLRRLEELHRRAREHSSGYAVLMVDVDHFKAINDSHGHAEGDLVLRRVADHLRDGVRVGDLVARWGGEEFCVVLPRTRLSEARALAERVAARIAASGPPRVTVSIGVAETGEQMQEGMDDVIARADGALYAAKAAGRNRVMPAPQAMPA